MEVACHDEDEDFIGTMKRDAASHDVATLAHEFEMEMAIASQFGNFDA